MSVNLIVRRYTGGVPDDVVSNFEDSPSRRYGYFFDQGLLRILEVELDNAPGGWTKVNVLRNFSTEGFLEVSGTKMLNELGMTSEEMTATWRSGDQTPQTEWGSGESS